MRCYQTHLILIEDRPRYHSGRGIMSHDAMVTDDAFSHKARDDIL